MFLYGLNGRGRIAHAVCRHTINCIHTAYIRWRRAMYNLKFNREKDRERKQESGGRRNGAIEIERKRMDVMFVTYNCWKTDMGKMSAKIKCERAVESPDHVPNHGAQHRTVKWKMVHSVSNWFYYCYFIKYIICRFCRKIWFWLFGLHTAVKFDRIELDKFCKSSNHHVAHIADIKKCTSKALTRPKRVQIR